MSREVENNSRQSSNKKKESDEIENHKFVNPFLFAN
jgi:hypothetical protein